MEQPNSVQFFHLNNGVMEVVLCNYGSTIVSIEVPDKNGVRKNVVAGFDQPEDYLQAHPYFGSTVGRYANRIAYGKFTIDENEYQLTTNDEPNHLHGGLHGFDKKMWHSEQTAVGVTFSYTSPDGEEGYPGNLQVAVAFSLSADNQLKIAYTATTDKDTILNLTNHSYFNLSGFESPNIHQHLLKVYAANYTVKNDNNVPSGEVRSVANTPYDFTHARPIGSDIDLLSKDRGYDINYVLDNPTTAPALAAELYEPESGRFLQVFTNQPGMQLYTANWWDGSLTGQQNKPYGKHGAVALETQAFPDAPNHPHFPSPILIPGQVYSSETVYQFSVL